MISQKTIGIASKLYECRDAAKSILGHQYIERMTELQSLIKSQANASECDELTAALMLTKGGNGGMRKILVLSAYVEMIEPS